MMRLCGDYRLLNAITTPVTIDYNRYPIPRIQDSTHLLHGKTIFSRIDMQRAYYDFPIFEKDIPKTAIACPFGLFEFLRLMFGFRFLLLFSDF